MNCNANANFSDPNKPSLDVYEKMYLQSVFERLFKSVKGNFLIRTDNSAVK